MVIFNSYFDITRGYWLLLVIIPQWPRLGSLVSPVDPIEGAVAIDTENLSVELEMLRVQPARKHR